MDSTTIIPAMRFRMFDIEHSAPYGDLRTAIREARYWESFPDSYSTEQVETARALHIAIWNSATPSHWQAATERVLALIANRSAVAG